MDAMCAVPWCVSFARAESKYCVVHAEHPEFVPAIEGYSEDDWKLEETEEDCENCGGSGECTCPDCDDEHECRECNGEGTYTVEVMRHCVTGEEVPLEDWYDRAAEASGFPAKWLRAAHKAVQP